jgi:hypothetical protein
MPPSDRNDLRHQAIRRALGRHQGLGSGTAAGAGPALAIWRDVTERLAPMIGGRGVDALASRALGLTTRLFPWLGPPGTHRDGTGPLAGLQARLEAQDPSVATEASVALLVAFTDLLETMIGASLTDRLLDPVWAAPPPASAKEHAS